MRRTKWYDGAIKPVRVGLYERRLNRLVSWSYWNGKYWGLLNSSAKFAVSMKLTRSVYKNLQWRGVTEKAE